MQLSFSSLCTLVFLVFTCMYPITQQPVFDPSSFPRPIHHLTTDDLSTSKSSNIFKIKLTSAKHGFLVSMGVGSESMDQVLYMDTGSSLLWIHCVPCKLHAPEPLFDPKKSTSFEVEDCVTSNNICRQTGNVRLEYKKKGHYQYILRYGKGYSEGYLARESFKFVTSTEVMEKIVFGCNKVSELNEVNGVLGLAANRLSLISQRKASRFSYCFGNISDPSYPYSFLAIGDEINTGSIASHKTPLTIEDKYYINLESIRVGGKLLDIDPLIFKRNSDEYTGGMAVDTGSTYTFIPRVALKKFEGEVIDSVMLPRNYSITYDRRYRYRYTRLCYNGVLTRDLRGFPKVQFTFQGGAIMELTPENVFHQYEEGIFCSVLLPSEILGTTISILGNVMQQYFYVSMHLHANEFLFRKADCALLN
ncbi:hypothetical protein C2S51_031490 [Perilla frutescens var. frutescens]|nr:hypothetical protein C2S51_031490 [Perilla frutescens var. frutescens]